MSLPLAWLAAAGLAVGAYVHLCLYRRDYRFIPTIGVLFLVNVIASAVVAIALLFVARRVGARVVVHLAGVAVAVGTLAAFGASRLPGGLFHFEERGLQPSPQSLVALLAESLGAAALVAGIAVDLRHRWAPRIPDERGARVSGHSTTAPILRR